MRRYRRTRCTMWVIATALVFVSSVARAQTPAPSAPPTATEPARAATAGAPADASQPTATATASKTDVSVGERFVVEVRARGPAGSSFAFPDRIADESFELEPLPDSVGATHPPGTARYRAAVFALGDAAVPAIPVRVRMPDGTVREVKTAPIPLHIVSLLPKSEDERKLTDVRPPLALGPGRVFWIGVIAALLLVAGVVAWLVTRKKRVTPTVEAPVPVVEPDLEARQALDGLIASGRLARAEYRPFYIDLTVIAKRYLERRLGLPILEMTTAEMLAQLRSLPQAIDLAPRMRDLAGAADQIKFAKGSGLTEEAERHLSETRSMIDQLEVRLRPTPPADGKAA